MYPEETTIGILFSTRYPIVVPKYQRAYAWGTEELEDFINDIMDLYQHKSLNSQSTKRHFFGGIVSIHTHQPGTSSGRKYEIVDGQQRLATFYMVLQNIKSTLNSIAIEAKQINDNEIFDEANAYVSQMTIQQLEYDEVESGKLVRKNRVTLSKADLSFFQQIFLNSNSRPTRESHNRIKSAIDSITEKLINPILDTPNYGLREKLDSLLLLKICLTDYCYLIHIFGEDKAEAYQLFSVLNDRGLSLSDGDLLRTRTLELLEPFSTHQEQVVLYWDSILAGKTSDIDKYLRCYYTSNIGQRPSQRDFFDKFKSNFLNFSINITPNQADEILYRVHNLSNEIDIYNSLSEGEWPYTNNSNSQVTNWDRNRLTILSNVFRHTLCFPLLQSASICLSEELFSSLVNLIEKFAFRYILISGAHPGGVEEIYYRYAKNIRLHPANFQLNALQSELSLLIQANAPDQVFEQQLLLELNYQQSVKRKTIKYFLTLLESYSNWFENNSVGNPIPDKMIAFNFDQTTIEHIYPRNSQRNFIDPALESKKNSIGNLTIWPPNENNLAGNSPFTNKIQSYSSSSVRLNRWISDNTQWTLQEIDAREQKLIDMAKLIFSL